MGEHRSLLERFRERFESKPLDLTAPLTAKDAELFFTLALKVADIGHLMAEHRVHMLWIERLAEEFFRQGDIEKELELPVSFLCDRGAPGVSSSQVGFFDFVVLPLYRTWTSVVPSCTTMLTCVEECYAMWQAVEEKAKQQ
jgi:cAMP-specific phosphodiesterase 4/high affinity cAMP-specific and IBMX-insensitive 3',5'-cyclic phosphodiesterase 8